jgi:hypothetical protein
MLAMVLERTLSAESVRAYKLEYLEHRNRLARLLSERIHGSPTRVEFPGEGWPPRWSAVAGRPQADGDPQHRRRSPLLVRVENP